MVKRVGLVGTGLIGRGWAIVFARAGWEVRLWDAAAGAVGRCLATAERNLADLEAIGLIASATQVRGRMLAATSLADALAGADYIQESVFEDRALKATVTGEIDRHAPAGVVIGSSCSAIPGSEFQGEVAGRSRCIVAHPANPPYLMPVVELVPAPFTSPETTDRAHAVMTEVGQVPVVLKREIEGFVMNRLQAGVVNEAVALVGSEVISPQDLDKVMRYSLGLRWSFMGPFETMDMNAPNGFADYAERYHRSYEAMGRGMKLDADWPSDAIERIETSRRELVPSDKVAERQAWRDRRLMALLKHIKDSDGRFGA